MSGARKEMNLFMKKHLLWHRKMFYADGAFFQLREICAQIRLKGVWRSVAKYPADNRLRNAIPQKRCGKVMAKDMKSFSVTF